MLSKKQLEYDHAAMLKAVNAAKAEMPKYMRYIKNPTMLVAFNIGEPSYRKRLFVWDLVDNELLRAHHAAHGVNSSNPNNRALAQTFGNVVGSKRSSLGAMVTAETYVGKHGRSLRLKGLQPGVNDNVYRRAIVLHSSGYVTDSYIMRHGRAGQSEGCPAVDPSIAQSLIDLIKNGVFFFIFKDV